MLQYCNTVIHNILCSLGSTIHSSSLGQLLIQTFYIERSQVYLQFYVTCQQLIFISIQSIISDFQWKIATFLFLVNTKGLRMCHALLYKQCACQGACVLAWLHTCCTCVKELCQQEGNTCEQFWIYANRLLHRTVLW